MLYRLSEKIGAFQEREGLRQPVDGLPYSLLSAVQYPTWRQVSFCQQRRVEMLYYGLLPEKVFWTGSFFQEAARRIAPNR